ncbi:hypothetical protein I6A84_19995 [Frankia sp. CNm7]|uniref:Uncharacterized protein n=1 Tax=Frankia nepalensis TaxID=1836974 RepID=A0A937RP69_9ACTN|nr:hypothetical protein [Frankia nepalensis]MBL7495614.1 hypothetical protein [Frankia nepalensis]MBL7508860.1 hypothetical protein [Frankia nepalensis]MBL7520308.1 hypothetical protein [Frankia nepalensis]MBL7630083.1 hypothetical protein [Frankia nepalensis]
MSVENGSTSTRPAPVLGSQYGTCGGKSAFARETSPGSWQVKVHDPSNPRAGHDGWVMIGSGWPTLSEASAATGLS